MAQPTTPPLSSPTRAYALRLHPGDDLREALLTYVAQHHLRAGAVLTCVGSLTVATLRLANQEGPTEYREHFEIVSLVDTLSAAGGSHLHLSIADSTGRTGRAPAGRLPGVHHRRNRAGGLAGAGIRARNRPDLWV